MQSLDRYLAELESARSDQDLGSFVRWPRTPIGPEIQERIAARVGASDLDVENRLSRPHRICRELSRLIDEDAIDAGFTLLDIACGDALVLLHVKRTFPRSRCYGVDLNADRFPMHDEVRRSGVKLYRVIIQDLFASQPPAPFDVVLMLNTYRGWENADLGPDESWIPRQADSWLQANGRHVLLTATAAQIRAWERRGHGVHDLGSGEDDSRLVHLAGLAR